MKYLIAAALAALLTACGGGDPEPSDEQVPTPGPVNCRERPAICR